jgi:S1-C subfamily serine protease
MHPIRQLTVNTILYQLERIQKNFEGILVGADRSKDLAVLKVKMPFDEIF